MFVRSTVSEDAKKSVVPKGTASVVRAQFQRLLKKSVVPKGMASAMPEMPQTSKGFSP